MDLSCMIGNRSNQGAYASLRNIDGRERTF